MQTSTGRHAHTPGPILTQAQAVQSSQAVRNTHSPCQKRRKPK